MGYQSFIGMGSRIMAGVKIGKHCIIGANSVVTRDVDDYSIVAGCPAAVIKRYNFNGRKWEDV
ncbi:DapH/DapD/GlmU-related protein [Clostridium perfringens]|uniref:acyltransferase n=1 Tax=Clostridium perfringens TaxID=1502 RepID=UPI00237B6BDB|nr:DapH/DapD/GlmU-related protein [Clostridium perfringens]MDK0954333.1 DapH/DapD/GlmU-related protein [Clostridium perfringens]